MEITKDNLRETMLEVELYIEDGRPCIFISHEGSSGCSYPLNSTGQLGELVADYVNVECIK